MSNSQKSQRSFGTGLVCSAARAGSTVLLFALLASLSAQSLRPPAPSLSEQGGTAGLRWLVQHAPVILSGEVLPADVTNMPPSGLAISSVDIRVDRAFRSGRAGERFRLSQWRGAGELVLFPHERVILFLHQPNAAGLSSSVAGPFGLLSVGGGGLVDVRALEMFGAQRGAAPGRVHRFGTLALSEMPASRADYLEPQKRDPVGTGSPRLAILPNRVDSLPERQLFARIAELVQQQSQRTQPIQKDAAHER